MKTVYILEDEPNIREVLEILLLSENYNVVSFPDIKQFNSRDLTTIPNLFMLDVMLPDGLGTDVCNSIKNDATISHIPVILMSAHAKLFETEKVCAPDDFISKPFDLNDMMSKISRLTGNDQPLIAN